jgi:hypothetical protein
LEQRVEKMLFALVVETGSTMTLRKLIAWLCRRPSASHISSSHSAFPTAARLARGWPDGHVDTAVHRLDSAHEGLKADVATLAGLQLGDHQLLNAELRSELALRQSAGIAQRNEFLFDPHGLQFRVDSRREIRVVFQSLVDGGDGTLSERHAEHLLD